MLLLNSLRILKRSQGRGELAGDMKSLNLQEESQLGKKKWPPDSGASH